MQQHLPATAVPARAETGQQQSARQPNRSAPVPLTPCAIFRDCVSLWYRTCRASAQTVGRQSSQCLCPKGIAADDRPDGRQASRSNCQTTASCGVLSTCAVHMSPKPAGVRAGSHARKPAGRCQQSCPTQSRMLWASPHLAALSHCLQRAHAAVLLHPRAIHNHVVACTAGRASAVAGGMWHRPALAVQAAAQQATALCLDTIQEHGLHTTAVPTHECCRNQVL